MVPRRTTQAARLRRVAVLAVAIGTLVAACSGSAATASLAATTTPSAAAATPAAPTSTPAPTKGPATEQLVLAGPAGASGAVTNAAIRCDEPSPGGLLINVIGRPTDPNLSVDIDVTAGRVTVRYDSGSGSTYVERDFAGTGVSNFDAATGAQIDATLTEVPTTGAHGSLGVMTAISGSIDCGDQMPGSSTLVLTGPTGKGALGGGLDPVNVECVTNTFGKSVSVVGMAQVASTATLAVVAVSPGTMSVSLSGDGFFRNTATAVATLTPTGVHVDADLVEQNPAAGKTANTIHITGDLTCGTTIGS